MADRERSGREASPAAAIIDSQSVKATEAGAPRGCDAGTKIKGRKHHAMVDTDWRALLLESHPRKLQDRDGGGPTLLCACRALWPFIARVFADGGYDQPRVAGSTNIVVKIARKSADQVRSTVLPRRWVVERFFACIKGKQRLAKEFEATVDSARAFLYAASVMLLIRRIAGEARIFAIDAYRPAYTHDERGPACANRDQHICMTRAVRQSRMETCSGMKQSTKISRHQLLISS